MRQADAIRADLEHARAAYDQAMRWITDRLGLAARAVGLGELGLPQILIAMVGAPALVVMVIAMAWTINNLIGPGKYLEANLSAFERLAKTLPPDEAARLAEQLRKKGFLEQLQGIAVPVAFAAVLFALFWNADGRPARR
jgi:hypothetical protein